jgi:alcohol dehydrogenase
MAFIADNYSPVRVIFGAGRLEELATIDLPGKKALICVTEDGLMEKLGIQKRVVDLLTKNGVESVIFDKVKPNPTKSGVMAAAAMAKENGCDFLIGLGGGSSIDTAKSASIMTKMDGDLWDYASVGTGGRKEVTDASPVVAITTTCGTGTETDKWCVVTNETTKEKLDFGIDKLYPAVSIIDPELLLTLPTNLTAYQGLDALFHAVECYMCNADENRLVSLYAKEAIEVITKYLPVVVKDGSDLEARTEMAYASCLLGGYIQSLTFVTSHHIIGQAMGGMYPDFPHGATLIVLAEEYYKKAKPFMKPVFEKLGSFMGEEPVPGDPGQSYINGLTKLMDKTGMRDLAMSSFGVDPQSFEELARIVVDVVGIDFDHYDFSKQDIVDILQASYK